MSESFPLREKYLVLIDDIVQATLKGKISSVAQVYQMLLNGVIAGTGEVFEMALNEKLDTTQHLLDSEADEIKQAKATRALRAIRTVENQWQKVQEQNKAIEIIATSAREITTSTPEERLNVFVRVTDPNQKHPLNLQQLQQLSKSLLQFAQVNSDLQQFSDGIIRGVNSWQRLQEHLVGWMYERQGNVGFGGIPGDNGPWSLWAKKVNSEFPKALFNSLAMEKSIIDFIEEWETISLSEWVEIALIFQYLQRGLVNWYDQQAYNIQAGSKLSISTYLTFAAIWSQMGGGFGRDTIYGEAASQIMLQILRNFAQRPYFPLYGGIFASFSGSYLRNALIYLDEPLRTVAGTQEKARILTLLGYSQRTLGEYEDSIDFHEQALEIASNAGDSICEIANYNHLSRTYVALKDYSEAINYSQRALILSRQKGDKTGEVNALANLGYSEVMQAQQLDVMEPESYEMAINYLQQGLKSSEKLGDLQSKALCASSLGIAYLVIQKPQDAIKHLETGFQTSQTAGDLYLQGLNLANLAEAYYSQEQNDKAIYTGCIGMYLLNQIASNEWRQPAGLLIVLEGKLGEGGFQKVLQQFRPRIISLIGVDGYDYLPQLLKEYQGNGD
ncbi:MAG: tetratricopeptide repeat protein [Cyanobacteria bacterium P01_A01_bin.84]